MNKCFRGGETENNYETMLSRIDACWDTDHSCEPHIHSFGDILCLHDDKTDHGHCPNPDYPRFNTAHWSNDLRVSR